MPDFFVYYIARHTVFPDLNPPLPTVIISCFTFVIRSHSIKSPVFMEFGGVGPKRVRPCPTARSLTLESESPLPSYIWDLIILFILRHQEPNSRVWCKSLMYGPIMSLNAYNHPRVCAGELQCTCTLYTCRHVHYPRV